MSQDSSKVESHGTVEKDAAPSRLQIGKPLLVLFGIVGSLASVVSIPLAFIQLIYIGGTDTAISMDGVIEGQSRILQLQSSIALRSPEEQLRSERRGNKLLGWALVSFAGLIAIPIITLFVWSLKTKTFKLRQDWVLLVSPFLFLVLGMYLLSNAQEVGPPFGF
jgi:hypothetical protein